MINFSFQLSLINILTLFFNQSNEPKSNDWSKKKEIASNEIEKGSLIFSSKIKNKRGATEQATEHSSDYVEETEVCIAKQVFAEQSDAGHRKKKKRFI